MKILHVFTLPSTAETFFDGQFGFLTENGHDITVVSASPLDCSFCERNKVKGIVTPIVRSMNPIADLKAIYRVLRIIRTNGYDIVVGHTPKGAMVAMLASFIAGTKKRIYYRHGLVYTTATGLKRAILKAVERITARCATLVVNVSPSLSTLAIKDCLNSDARQSVIGHGTCGGIDTQNLFNPELVDKNKVGALRTELGIAPTDFVIGFCGRLCRDKGITELVDGFDMFRKHNHKISVKLLLVGSFDKRDVLSDSIKDRILKSEDILFTGLVKHAILPLYYSLMDVFVFPSYREGFGMSVIEASAMQIPILVSRSHGCVDSIREHQTGEYIELSARGIYNGLETMKDTSLRKSLGEGGRKFATQEFDYKVIWPQILALYKDVIR